LKCYIFDGVTIDLHITYSITKMNENWFKEMAFIVKIKSKEKLRFGLVVPWKSF